MATSAGTVYVDVRPDLDNFNRQLSSGVSGTASGGIMGKLKGFGDKLGGTFGGAFAGGFAAMGLTEGARMVTDFLGSAITAASDLQEVQNKTEVVFKASSDAIMQWAEGSAEAMGMSERSALEGASTFKAMTDAMGVSASVGTEMSTTLVQLASDMASFHNADPSEMLLAFRSALSGEFEPMKKYGVVMNEATLSQEAMALGLSKTGTELSAAQKAQAAYSLLLKQTTAAQGDFARTSDSLANQQRIAQAEFENMKAEIGQELLPVVTDITRVTLEFAKMLSPVLTTALSSALEVVTPLTESIAVLSDVMDGTKGPVEAMSGNWENLVNIASRFNPLLDHGVSTFQQFRGTTQLSASAQKALADQMGVTRDKIAAFLPQLRAAGGAHRDAAAGAREQKRAELALVDPLFAVKDAAMGVREAERTLDGLRQKGIRSGPKYRQAIDDVYRAHVDLEGAQRDLKGSAKEAEVGIGELDRQLRDDMQQAGLTRREIDLLAASYRNLASAAGVARSSTSGGGGLGAGHTGGTGGGGGQTVERPVVIEDRTTDGVTARERHNSRMARTRRAR